MALPPVGFVQRGRQTLQGGRGNVFQEGLSETPDWDRTHQLCLIKYIICEQNTCILFSMARLLLLSSGLHMSPSLVNDPVDAWGAHDDEIFTGPDNVPSKTVVVGTAKTDDAGFYAVTGFALTECYGGPRLFLELYDSKLAVYPISKVEVPDKYGFLSGQPAKTFEANITAEYSPPPS